MTINVDGKGEWVYCPHSSNPKLCKDCQVEEMHEKKGRKSGVPIKALKNRSKEQEREIAKGYKAAGFPNAKRQVMSGAIHYLKGDVDPGKLLLVEAKMSRSGRIIINPEWLEKVEQESKDVGRAGFYALHAWVAAGSDNYKRAVIVSEPLWYAILGKWNDVET